MKIYLSAFLGIDSQRYELLRMMNKELTDMEIIELKKDYIKYKWNDKVLVLTRPDLSLDPEYVELNIDNLTDNKKLVLLQV